MKKRFTLMMLAALVAVASVAQPMKRKPELRPQSAEQVLKQLAARPKPAKAAKAPRKVSVTRDAVLGGYIAHISNDSKYDVEVTLEAGDADNEVILSGFYYFGFNELKATLDTESGMLAFELGQVVYTDASYGDILLAAYYSDEEDNWVTDTSGTIYALIDEDGIITFESDKYFCSVIAEGDYAGYFWTYFYPGMTLTPGIPEFAVTPWDDRDLTYGSTEGDVVGNWNSLVSGLSYNSNKYVEVTVTTTDLAEPYYSDDKLALSVGDNLQFYNPILVGGNEIAPSETYGYGNDSISTIAGEHEYIYIDNYGTEDDFAAVKDVLEGKIAVCNRGSITFSSKANAAMANGAAGLIVVNNQSGTINMNLSDYEYDKPAVAITMADGQLLKDNATYVEGDAPYYQGTLTVSSEQKHRNGSTLLTFGYGCEAYDTEISAVVQDWKLASPGFTYQATINYEAILYEIDVEAGTITSVDTLKIEPTTLTVTIPYADDEVTFTPWPDSELTYGNTEGDVVGYNSGLLHGVPDNLYDYAVVNVTNTHLVNVADPDDQLIMYLTSSAWGEGENNLIDYNPLYVSGQEVEYTQTSGYGNKPISTIAGDHEYIYIDNYGTEDDFAAVKNVLAGKIAVCNRGSITFSVKANAAMANGAIGLIVVNNQDGTINMNLGDYEYDKPAVAITKADGEWLKENATLVDGDAPYYQGTLTVGELVTGHTSWGLGYGYNRNYGTLGNSNYFADHDMIAVVPDWSNATPGATYKATITYPGITYYTCYAFLDPTWGYYVSDSLDGLVNNQTTTLTVTIPDPTGIEEVTTEGKGDGRAYNLMGIPVGEDYKGIVIKNGKKVLIK